MLLLLNQMIPTNLPGNSCIYETQNEIDFLIVDPIDQTRYTAVKWPKPFPQAPLIPVHIIASLRPARLSDP